MAECGCKVMKAIGGYFELADYEEGIFPHQNGILLNTGRNALEYILRGLGDVNNIYLPYYTCEVVLEPLKKLHIPWSYYHINYNLELANEIHLQNGEYVIINNYFGIKDAYIHSLANKYDNHLIFDFAQSFFSVPVSGRNVFYSTRKYVGVADGGVAYLGNTNTKIAGILEEDSTSDHDSHLYKRKMFGPEEGFADFQENELKLGNQPIRRMSNATKNILAHIDYDAIVSKRRANYAYLHSRLKELNLLKLPELNTFVCPMVYPFLPLKKENLRNYLIGNKIFVATYWPNVKQLPGFEIEYQLANRLIAIPIDQRYGKDEMDFIIDCILNF